MREEPGNNGREDWSGNVTASRLHPGAQTVASVVMSETRTAAADGAFTDKENFQTQRESMKKTNQCRKMRFLSFLKFYYKGRRLLVIPEGSVNASLDGS